MLLNNVDLPLPLTPTKAHIVPPVNLLLARHRRTRKEGGGGRGKKDGWRKEKRESSFRSSHNSKSD